MYIRIPQGPAPGRALGPGPLQPDALQVTLCYIVRFESNLQAAASAADLQNFRNIL